MPLSESGQKIVDTFTRQATQLVERCERAESDNQELIAGQMAKNAALMREWETQVADIARERDEARAMLIDRNARLDLVEGELTVTRGDLGMLQREHNGQTAELEGLRRAAASFGNHVEAVLGKNLEASNAERNLHNADEMERLLAIEHAKRPQELIAEAR